MCAEQCGALSRVQCGFPTSNSNDRLGQSPRCSLDPFSVSVMVLSLMPGTGAAQFCTGKAFWAAFHR